jgi:fructokinase
VHTQLANGVIHDRRSKSVTFYTGLDIGGTKIAGAVFDSNGQTVDQRLIPTPKSYVEFIDSCSQVIEALDKACNQQALVGVGVPYAVANMPFLVGKPFQKDLESALGRSIRIANDANCAALSEAFDGAGAGHESVLGLILGTGVAGGFVVHGRIVEGANGLTGEIGHLPLPYYMPEDGPIIVCGCGQKGCIEKLVAGPALARLYESRTGKHADASHIAELAKSGDIEATQTLDRYYTVLAKALVAVLHSFDPHIIVVSGGLNGLPGLYEHVPKRWGDFALAKAPKTLFVAAKHGSMSGLRGAAWLWRQSA